MSGEGTASFRECDRGAIPEADMHHTNRNHEPVWISCGGCEARFCAGCMGTCPLCGAAAASGRTASKRDDGVLSLSPLRAILRDIPGAP
jgi:hypothetical protein